MKPQANSFGRLLSARVTCGYGERLVVQFDRPLPQFINRGYNVFTADNFRVVTLDQFPPANHSSNDCNEWQKEAGQFMGWVKARFTNGESWCFINLHHSAYDAAKKQYVRPVYSIEG